MREFPVEKFEPASVIEAERSSDVSSSFCPAHQKPGSALTCERCGAFLCFDCVWSSDLRASCPSCAGQLPIQPRLLVQPPTDFRNALANHINLSIAAGLLLGTLAQLVTSSKFGYLFALQMNLLGLVGVSLAVMMLFPFYWLWLLMANPIRRRRVARFEESKVGLLKQSFLSSPAEGKKGCRACQKDLPLAEGFCESCNTGLLHLVRERGRSAPPVFNFPPWTPPTRRNLLVLLVWTQVLSAFFFMLPGSVVLLCLNWAKLSFSALAIGTLVVFWIFGDFGALLVSELLANEKSEKPRPEAWAFATGSTSHS